MEKIGKIVLVPLTKTNIEEGMYVLSEQYGLLRVVFNNDVKDGECTNVFAFFNKPNLSVYMIEYCEGFAGSYDNPILTHYPISFEQVKMIHDGYFDLNVEVSFEEIFKSDKVKIFPQKLFSSQDMEEAFNAGGISDYKEIGFHQWLETYNK